MKRFHGADIGLVRTSVVDIKNPRVFPAQFGGALRTRVVEIKNFLALTAKYLRASQIEEIQKAQLREGHTARQHKLLSLLQNGRSDHVSLALLDVAASAMHDPFSPLYLLFASGREGEEREGMRGPCGKVRISPDTLLLVIGHESRLGSSP